MDDVNVICSHIQGYYKDLFECSFSTPIDYSIVQEVIPSLVTQEENNFLLKVPDFEEVHCTVFEMDPLNAPGPVGFPGKFFQHCWDIVGSNVVSAM